MVSVEDLVRQVGCRFLWAIGITLPLAVTAYLVASALDEGPTVLGVLRVVGVTVGISAGIFLAMTALAAGVRRLRH